MTDEWDRFLQKRLIHLEKEGRLRVLRPVEQAVRPVLLRGGRRLLNLSSNNYLGLAGHPALIEATRKAAGRGAGSTASRLIVGDDEAFHALEEKLAAFKGTEAALVFGSGYTANVGALSALLDSETAVFSDELNHASIVDGIRLSKAARYIYRHGDPDHLEALLKEADRKGFRRKLIVTDTVFSMDGDLAPLGALVELKERYGAALMVDEAHGGGVFGPRGEGVAHHLGVADRVDLHMGTFSKAFGVYGAYVAGRKGWIRYLFNTARSFIYTTALPPAVIGAIDTALDLVREAHDRREKLHRLARRFRGGLAAIGLDTAGSVTQIVPAVIGDSRRTLSFSRILEERGILAVAIRPPTVPDGTARIRFSLTADHEEADLDRVLSAVAEAADGILK